MNSKLFNFKNTAILAVFSLIVFIGLSAFNSNDNSQSNLGKTDRTWKFTGTDVDDPLNATLYVLSSDNTGCFESGDFPCLLNVPDDIDDFELQDYFDITYNADPDNMADDIVSYQRN